MRTTMLRGALAALTVTALVGAVAPAATAAPDRTLRPARIERGPAVTALHMRGHTIVDPVRDRKVRVTGFERTWLLGRHRNTYLVLAGDEGLANWQLLRVRPDGEPRALRSGRRYAPEMVLSADGSHVALWRTAHRSDRTRITVVHSRTGDVLRSRWFRGFPSVADYGPRRLVLSRWGRHHSNTSWWNPHNNVRRPIIANPSGLVDIEADRLTYYDGDPYQGGCQHVVRLSAPDEEVWQSCEDRVFAFSPHGRRMVTGHILTDGLGPNEVRLRGARGRLLATFHAQWFGFLHFENERRLLVEAVGKRYIAAVRCTPEDCERVSKLHDRRGDRRDLGMDWSFPR